MPDRMPFLPPEIAKIFIISTLKSTMGEVDERYAARAASDRSAVFVKASATAMTGILIASASLFIIRRSRSEKMHAMIWPLWAVNRPNKLQKSYPP